MSFNVGDVFRLIHEGPDMTVTEVTDELIFVTWLSQDGKSESGSFPAKDLKPLCLPKYEGKRNDVLVCDDEVDLNVQTYDDFDRPS
ncbi:MAG: DUF2158 domain-containing protein [Methylophaga sp.]|uniref:DUF2158 domain-containing protein n=1 Tax=Methylophaga sp. TaxID=2024840 RepID=UPI00299DCCF5|nr:DUF2158 domain-containing protein [Methylophaga sp.]MDX1751478.1 DUF2158 domain-containing protein [Methylophaga sp.]